MKVLEESPLSHTTKEIVSVIFHMHEPILFYTYTDLYRFIVMLAVSIPISLNYN